MRTMVGLRFYNMDMVQYTKKAITILDQIQNLEDKGLKFFDVELAKDYMLSVGYFRLDSYFHTFMDSGMEQFIPNTTFETIIYHYRFDCELRSLIFAAIQDIEIAIRTRVVYFFSLANGPFWYAERKNFKDRIIFFNNLSLIIKEVNRSKEDFILDHFEKYDFPNLPPAWKALETVTIGSLASLYKECTDVISKKNVARSFNIPKYTYLESWLESMRILRNACAHHARLWNKRIQIPSIPDYLPLSWIRNKSSRPEKIYSHLCYIAYIQQTLRVASPLKKQLKDLLNRYPAICTYSMGFTPNWEQEALWL